MMEGRAAIMIRGSFPSQGILQFLPPPQTSPAPPSAEPPRPGTNLFSNSHRACVINTRRNNACFWQGNFSFSNFEVLKGCSPCVTPHGRFWSHDECRILRGEELLALQGVWLPERLKCLPWADSDFLQNLAGNSFNAFCCTSATLTWMVVSSLLHGGRCVNARVSAEAAEHAEVPPLSSFGASSTVQPVQFVEAPHNSDESELSDSSEWGIRRRRRSRFGKQRRKS